jgi:hypothetical protein
VEVTITQPDGSRVSVSKKSADDKDFALQDLPQGREIQSSWSVNALGGSLSGLQLDEVVADSQLDWSQASHLRLLTADGLEIAADLVKADDKSWIRLVASAHPPPPGQDAGNEPAQAQAESGEQAGGASAGQAAAATPDQTGAEELAGQAAVEKAAAEDLGKRVETINHRVQGWAYAIPQYKFDVMNKTLEDLLKPLDKPGAKDKKAAG